MVGEVLYVSQEIGETSPYWLTVIQGEHDYRTIVLTPLINGEIADINGMYSYIESTKTDGYSYMIPCTIENNTIIIAIKEQMTTTVGKYTADVNIEGVGVRETALTIRFTVRASSADDASILSQNDFAVLDSMDSRFAETMKTYIDSNYDLSGQSAAASASADSAAESASQAGQAASDAAESQNAAAISATDAGLSATAAGQAASQAAASATSASDSASAASASATQAADSATASGQSATNANAAMTDAQTARDATITARTGAETARTGAETAQAGAQTTLANAILKTAQTLTSAEQAQARANIGAAKANNIVVDRPTTWAEVQRIVRAGLASQVFAIGDQLTCKRGTTTLTWDIIGFDHDVPVDPNHPHSMTLQLHDGFKNYRMDDPQALYYAETALVAGTYHYTDGSTVKQFTTTQGIPAGGQICVSGTNAVVYASRTTTTATETVAITTGSGGTELAIINNINRTVYGSGRWETASAKQWMNADRTGWWTPKTVYDRPPSYVSDTGFLTGMDTEFLAVLGDVTKRTALSPIADGGGYEDASEKFFLPSKSECYFTPISGVDEGAPYEYYSLFSDLSAAGDTTDSNRIKRVIGTSVACSTWLRSQNKALTTHFYLVTEKGDNGARAANYTGYYLSPCVNII